MHLDSAGEAARPREVLCPVDRTPFVPARSWQKFCSTACRNTYHQSMTPEALRRDIDTLKAQVVELKAGNEALNRRVAELEAAVARCGA
jgi:prefoldin subunit 5